MIRIEANVKAPEISRALAARLTNANPLWERMSAWLRGVVDNLWGTGGRYNRPSWPAISARLFGKPRFGTDGQQHGEYGPDSIPLHASGRYQESFGAKYQTPKTLTWGSRHPLAAQMPHIGRGNRYALPDGESAQFRTEANEIVTGFVDWALKQAILDAQAGGRK